MALNTKQLEDANKYIDSLITYYDKKMGIQKPYPIEIYKEYEGKIDKLRKIKKKVNKEKNDLNFDNITFFIQELMEKAKER